jgi:twitching motility two-component system response regulator PilG
VLSKLDQLTIKEFNFIPELVIGREDKQQQLSEEMLNKVLPTQNADVREIRMLVVDDSEPVRKQLEIQLNMLGMCADLAESAERAMELIEKRPYACIFLDVVMPGADGYSVCKAVKRDSRLKQTPVVMLTSKSSPFDRVKGKLAGCNAYLTKPVDRDAFGKVIKPYLSSSVATSKSV